MDRSPTDRVARELRAARDREGLTQAELAARAQISVNTIGRFETGQREPRLSHLVRIAEALGFNGSRLLPPFMRKDAA